MFKYFKSCTVYLNVYKLAVSTAFAGTVLHFFVCFPSVGKVWNRHVCEHMHVCPRARSVHKENRHPLVKTWRKEFRFEQREEKAEHSGKRTVMWCDMWLMRLALKDYNLSHLPAVLRKRWLFNKHDSTVKAIQSGSRLAAWFVESGLFKLHVLNYSFVRIRRIRQQCFA